MPEDTNTPTRTLAPDNQRDPWLDNARFILIALVIFGHCLEPLLDQSAWFSTTYRFLYLFHMPAFAFLSGAVASSGADVRLFRNVVFRLLLPYVAFQGLYTLAAQMPQWPDDGPLGVATPYWLLWYLLSLAGWRLLLPVFARLRRPLTVAVALAVAAGCASDVGYYLSLSRTLVFFPMFLLGWRYCDAWRSVQRARWTSWLAIATLLLLFGAASSASMDSQWLYGSHGYASLDTGNEIGAFLRLLQLTAGVAGTAAILTLIPRQSLPISPMGARSLSAYLLHGFLVKFALAAGLFGVISALPDALLWPMLLMLTLACALLLCTPLAHRLLQPVIAPRWLEKRLWHGAQ